MTIISFAFILFIFAFFYLFISTYNAQPLSLMWIKKNVKNDVKTLLNVVFENDQNFFLKVV
jgi:hypothetical protein